MMELLLHSLKMGLKVKCDLEVIFTDIGVVDDQYRAFGHMKPTSIEMYKYID